MTRRPHLARVCVAAAVAVAFAGLIVHGELAGRGSANAAEAHTVAIGHDHGRAAVAPRSLHSQPLSRARGFSLAVLAAVIVGAACSRRIVQIRRAVSVFRNSVPGLPPGRAPPLARIA